VEFLHVKLRELVETGHERDANL